MSVFATPAAPAAGRPRVRAKTDRERDAERKREQRSLFRDVSVPWPENLRRRRRSNRRRAGHRPPQLARLQCRERRPRRDEAPRQQRRD